VAASQAALSSVSSKVAQALSKSSRSTSSTVNSVGQATQSADQKSAGIALNLKYTAGWTDSQRAAAGEKVARLNEEAQAGMLRVTQVQRGGTSASSRFKRAGGEVSPGSDVDHVIDLQLGGADDLANMSPLDASVNRSLGAQIAAQLRGSPAGTCVISASIC